MVSATQVILIVMAIMIVVPLIVVFIGMTAPNKIPPKKLGSVHSLEHSGSSEHSVEHSGSSEHSVEHSGSSEHTKRLVYSNGHSVSLYDAWKGSIPSDSVFSPSNPEWYFDISGLDSEGKLIFSTSWHVNMVLNQIIPKYEDIKRWQVTLATNIGSSPPADVYQKLKWE
jgi:hypothetical protein